MCDFITLSLITTYENCEVSNDVEVLVKCYTGCFVTGALHNVFSLVRETDG